MSWAPPPHVDKTDSENLPSITLTNKREVAGQAQQKQERWSAEADLGMFSMFGRTGAPTKGGPTKAQKNYFMLQ